MMAAALVGCNDTADPRVTTRSNPDTPNPRVDTTVGPSGPHLFVFTRDAKLLDSLYRTVGCAKRGTGVEATGTVFGPKGADGRPLRDPDDGGVLAQIYEVGFARDHPCGDDGFVARPGTTYLASPLSLSRQTTDLPATCPGWRAWSLPAAGAPTA